MESSLSVKIKLEDVNSRLTLKKFQLKIIIFVSQSCCNVFGDLELGSVGHQYWKLDGSDVDISSNNASEVSIGRCSEGKSLTFNTSISYVRTPCLDATGASFTVSMWLYLQFTTKGQFPTIYAEMRQKEGESKGFYLSAKDRHFHLTVIHGVGEFIEILQSNDEIKLKTWTHFVVTFLAEKRELTMYIDGKKQDHASLWQGIDFFSKFGIPNCTIGNMPDFRLSNNYQLFGSVMDFYLLNYAVSDDYTDSLRGKFHIISHVIYSF